MGYLLTLLYVRTSSYLLESYTKQRLLLLTFLVYYLLLTV